MEIIKIQHKTKRSIVKGLLCYFIEHYLLRLNSYYSKKLNSRLAIYAHDYIGTQITLYGIFENDLLDELIGVIKIYKKDIGDCIAIDIGANIGNHSRFFSQFFSEVWAFEPNPYSVKLLNFNCQELKNIRVFETGIGDKDEILILSDNNENRGMSSFKRKFKNHTDIAVNVCRLDDVVSNYVVKNQKIGLIKIDVEGMELSALQGAINTIQKFRPIIALEQWESEFLIDKKHTHATKFISDLGYNFFYSRNRIPNKNWAIQKFRTFLRVLKSNISDVTLISSAELEPGNYDLLICVPKEILQSKSSQK